LRRGLLDGLLLRRQRGRRFRRGQT